MTKPSCRHEPAHRDRSPLARVPAVATQSHARARRRNHRMIKGNVHFWHQADIGLECVLDGGQFHAAVLTGCWAWRSSYCAGLGVFVQGAGFIFLNPDADQLPGEIVSFGQPVKRLPATNSRATCRLNSMLCERCCLAMASIFRKPSTACQSDYFNLSSSRGAFQQYINPCPLSAIADSQLTYSGTRPLTAFANDSYKMRPSLAGGSCSRSRARSCSRSPGDMPAITLP